MTEGTSAIYREVDARGLNCPLPILRTKKALNDMTSGQLLRVTATDPASQRDFQAFSKQTGNALVESAMNDGVYTYVLRRK
jgi:tRNA 2-thiouridine synthesizing protein A